MGAITVDRLSAEEFLALPAPARGELIEGRVVAMTASGAAHSGIAIAIASALWAWNQQQRRGLVGGSDLGCVLARDPDTVRVPDVAFVSWDRLGDQVPEGFCPVAPDLVVEVVSPTDRRDQVLARVSGWLAAGTLAVWVVWPASQQVWVCRAEADPVVLGPGETLATEELLPGFALAVDEVFAVVRRAEPPSA